MSHTDTTEKGLETLIMLHMTGVDGLHVGPDDVLKEFSAERPTQTSSTP